MAFKFQTLHIKMYFFFKIFLKFKIGDFLTFMHDDVL